MNHITLNTLFPSGSQIQNNGLLNVNSLFKGLPLNNFEKEDFNSQSLINNITQRRKKKLQYMIDCYNKCCKHITNINNDNQYDTFFTVPEYIPEAIEYNSIECLEYISINLNQKLIDTYIINNTTVFITWNDLELKLYMYSKNKN